MTTRRSVSCHRWHWTRQQPKLAWPAAESKSQEGVSRFNRTVARKAKISKNQAQTTRLTCFKRTRVATETLKISKLSTNSTSLTCSNRRNLRFDSIIALMRRRDSEWISRSSRGKFASRCRLKRKILNRYAASLVVSYAEGTTFAPYPNSLRSLRDNRAPCEGKMKERVGVWQCRRRKRSNNHEQSW